MLTGRNLHELGLMNGTLLRVVDEVGVSAQELADSVPGESAEPGLLLLTAGKQTLRLLPPYIISEKELEQGLEILRGIL